MNRSSEPDPPSDPAGEGTPELPSLPTRVLQVLVSPGRLFERLAERPVWLDVMLVVAALSLAATLLIPEEMVREAMMQQARRAGEGADPQSVEEMAGVVRTAGIVASVVGPVVVAAVIAGVSYLIFSLVLGGRSTYRKLFSAAAHVMLIPSLGALVTVPLILSTGDPQTSLALHLLLPETGPESYLYRLLRGLNVFGLAAASVMGVAVGRLYRHRSTGSAVAILVCLYAALKAAMAIAGAA